MGKTLLRGFLTIAPLAATIAVIIWLFNSLEGIFSPTLREILGDYYFPGLSILFSLIFLYITGLLVNYWFVRRLYQHLEQLVKKTPLLKTIYGAVTDLMSFFNSQNTQRGKMVMVEVAKEIHLIGLLTRENFEDLPSAFSSNDKVAVFFPFSYQIGGFTALIPRSRITFLDCSIEQGLRFTATAGAPSTANSSTTTS